MEPLPVVDYERMRRVYPKIIQENTWWGDLNAYTYICLFFIGVGVLVLIKRFKDKIRRVHSDKNHSH